MLTRFQDGYGPASEYYHDGQYSGMPVSKLLVVVVSIKADLV
jgi:hypothetical protein